MVGPLQQMGVVVVVSIWQLDIQLPVQSVPINIHREVCSIQHYVIKF